MSEAAELMSKGVEGELGEDGTVRAGASEQGDRIAFASDQRKGMGRKLADWWKGQEITPGGGGMRLPEGVEGVFDTGASGGAMGVGHAMDGLEDTKGSGEVSLLGPLGQLAGPPLAELIVRLDADNADLREASAPIDGGRAERQVHGAHSPGHTEHVYAP